MESVFDLLDLATVYPFWGTVAICVFSLTLGTACGIICAHSPEIVAWVRATARTNFDVFGAQSPRRELFKE